MLRFTRAVKAPFEDEEPQIITPEELAERYGDAGDKAPELLRRAEKLGILRPLADGNFEELSPRLGRAASELAALGVSSETALDVAREIRKHADAVAKTFVELFVREVWKPFEDQGRPDQDLPKVREAVERLRPLASDALLAVFQLAMTDAVEQRVGREFERLDRGVAGARRPRTAPSARGASRASRRS